MKIELKGGADAGAAGAGADAGAAGASDVIQLQKTTDFSSFKYEMIAALSDMEVDIVSGIRTNPFTYFIPKIKTDATQKIEKLLKDNPLAAGSFGAVYKTKLEFKGVEDDYIIKTDFGEKNSILKNAQDLLMREARMINIISNGIDKKNANHIVLEGILKFKGIKYLIIDLCLPKKGEANTVDLESIIHKNKTYLYNSSGNYGPTAEKNILIWSRQIRDGLKHINSRGIVHRDLAARNILVCDGIAKISDFGLAYKDPEDKCSNCKDYEDQILRTYPIYTTSPVVIRDTSNNLNRKNWTHKFGDFFSCDLYSYGLLLLHMFTGIMPAYSRDKMILCAYKADYHRVFLKYIFSLYDTKKLRNENSNYTKFLYEVKYKIIYPCVLQLQNYKFNDSYLEEILTAGDNFISSSSEGEGFTVEYTEEEWKDLYEFFGGDRNNISINTSRGFVPSGTFDGVELPKRTKNYEYQSDVNQELRRLSEQIRKLRPSQLNFISSSLNTSIDGEIQSIKIEELKKGIKDKVKEMDDIVEEEIEEIDDDSITLSMDTSALKYYSSSSSDGDVQLYQSQIIKNLQGIQYEVKQPGIAPSHLYQVREQGSADGPLYEVQKSKGKGPARPAVALYEVKMYKTPVYKVKSEVSNDEAGPAQEPEIAKASAEQARPAIETIPRPATQSIPDEELYASERTLYSFLSNVTERI